MNEERSSRPSYLVIAVTIVIALLIVVDRTTSVPWMRPVTNQLYQWTILLGAVGILLGMANVGYVHLRRIFLGQADWPFSLALVSALCVVLAGGLLSPLGVESPVVEWLFDALIAPGQASLFALLAFFMAAAAFRFLRVGRAGGGWMLAGALLILTAQIPVSSTWMPPGVANFAGWVLDVPGMATLRGAVLGSSIAVIVVSIRYLLRGK